MANRAGQIRAFIEMTLQIAHRADGNASGDRMLRIPGIEQRAKAAHAPAIGQQRDLRGKPIDLVNGRQKFIDEGGKMNLVCQIIGDPAPTYKQFKPLAMYNQGEQVDKAFQDGEMDTVKEWCKKVRDLGSLVGVGTHKPEVIAYVEEKGWDVDFYAGCVYNRTRSTEEWKQTLNGEIQEMQGETYLKGDPARMYKVMRQTKKPCFAFKIFAASRISDRGIEPALRTAFASIKPIDGVFVGVWPYRKDEVRENAELVAKILKRSLMRARPLAVVLVQGPVTRANRFSVTKDYDDGKSTSPAAVADSRRRRRP